MRDRKRASARMINLDEGALNDEPPCLPFLRTRVYPKLNTSMGDNQINFICKDNAVTCLSREIILSANVCGG